MPASMARNGPGLDSDPVGVRYESLDLASRSSTTRLSAELATAHSDMHSPPLEVVVEGGIDDWATGVSLTISTLEGRSEEIS